MLSALELKMDASLQAASFLVAQFTVVAASLTVHHRDFQLALSDCWLSFRSLNRPLFQPLCLQSTPEF